MHHQALEEGTPTPTWTCRRSVHDLARGEISDKHRNETKNLRKVFCDFEPRLDEKKNILHKKGVIVETTPTRPQEWWIKQLCRHQSAMVQRMQSTLRVCWQLTVFILPDYLSFLEHEKLGNSTTIQFELLRCVQAVCTLYLTMSLRRDWWELESCSVSTSRFYAVLINKQRTKQQLFSIYVIF